MGSPFNFPLQPQAKVGYTSAQGFLDYSGLVSEPPDGGYFQLNDGVGGVANFYFDPGNTFTPPAPPPNWYKIVGSPPGFPAIINQAGLNLTTAISGSRLYFSNNTPGAIGNIPIVTGGGFPGTTGAYLEGMSGGGVALAGGNANALQGIPLANFPPTIGQILVFDGAVWEPGPDPATNFERIEVSTSTTALNVTIENHYLVSSGTPCPCTLAAGLYQGQIQKFIYRGALTPGNIIRISPANPDQSYNTVILSSQNDTATLQWLDSNEWALSGLTGTASVV